jgi:selenocysteine lyase/cysteine desulfurase
MLASQRDLFEMPRDVCYLNAAGWSPLPRAVMAAGHAGVERKGRPWALDPDLATVQVERARRAAAALIGADAGDIAVVSSVAYGVASAAKILPTPAGSRVLLLEDDHSSPVLEWLTRAPLQGFAIETVLRPASGDWTAAVLEAVDRRGAAPVSIASISSVHWSDGGAIDLAPVSAALKKQGAALLVDATHAAGALPLDVAVLDPDIVVFPTYKWLLGPYGRAFLYVSRRHQHGIPLEQTSYGRRAVAAEQPVYLADTAHVDGARRFDMAERDHFVSLEMASVGMEMVAAWGSAAISARLGHLTRLMAEGLGGLPVTLLPERHRAPHVLSVGFPGAMPADLMQRLASSRIFAAQRIGRLRLSPHVYNDAADAERLVTVLRAILRGK